MLARRTLHGSGLVVLAAMTAVLSTSTAGTLIDDRALAAEADGRNWASYGRTFSENHFSPLREINDGNIERLHLAWYYDLPVVPSVYTAPLAVDGVLYFAIGYSVVHALDARTGKLLWRYDPDVASVAGIRQRGGWGVRGIAFWEGKVYTGTLDGRLIALDAQTGEPVWSVQTLEPDDGRTITGPPWVFGGKVAIGHGGADLVPARGYVTTYDAQTGRRLWRFHTVPGNPDKGFEDPAHAMAAKTWKGEWWKFGGGGTVWHAMAYDPRFNRLYIGTGNGFPWNQKIRSPGGGDNLFLCSIVALDADTGRYVWHYQINPGETWDFNAAMDIELADLVIEGRERPVILHAPKNGFFYVIDRENGKLLSAEKFAKVNWAERIDLETGRPVENPAARFPDGKSVLMFPSSFGAHNTSAMSFNPLTGLAYIPASDLGMVYADPDTDLSTWRPRPGLVVNSGLGAANPSIAVPAGTSSLLAWDPLQQKAVWSVPQQGLVNGGTATTAGNLVFQGQVTGEFTAYAADSGKRLWFFDAQAGIQAQPITYLADGTQQVTVIAGWRGMGSSSGIKPEWDYRSQKRRVLTFTLNGKATLPLPEPPVDVFADDPAFEVDAQKALVGQTVVSDHCVICHGVGLVSGGTAPDLRRSAVPLSREAFTAVLHGSLSARGMPRFEELTPQQIESLQHYIQQRAREAAARSR